MKSIKRMVLPKDLELSKVLKNANVTIGQRAKIIGFSYATIMALDKCETWDDFLKFREEQKLRMRAKVKSKTPSEEPNLGKVTVTATGVVLNQQPLTQFEIKMLNILTEIEQDLDDINQNIMSK